MSEGLYLLPAGVLHGAQALAAMEAGRAGALAGARAAFCGAQIIRREGPGRRFSQWMTWAQLQEAARKDARLARRLELVQRPRPAIAGMEWRKPLIMGIVNVTPDSFSDGGLHADAQGAIAHGRALAAAGADILDIGGESTRPGAAEVPPEEELARVIPVIEALAREGYRVSVDTRKAAVMEAAARAGAAIINDVSALSFDPGAPAVAARLGLPVVLMHARGEPRTMQDDPVYDDVVLDVFDALQEQMQKAVAAGVAEEKIIADPGIGFGKTCAHNLALMGSLALFHGLGAPILLGASRKRFIGAITGVKDAAGRLAGSLAAAQTALAAAVQIVRVHDVSETVQMARMVEAMH